MRIGIDIRKYYDFGIGTYIRNLIDVLQNQSNLDCVYFSQDELKESLRNSLKGNFISDNSKKYSLRELFSVSKKANSQRLDLFHSPHYTLPVNLKMPSIVTIHDIIHLRLNEHFSFPKRAYAYQMIRHACFASSAIIVDSEFGKKELLNVFSINEDKIHVVPLGVHQSYFIKAGTEEKEAFLRKYTIGKPYILYTGSLKPHKNVPILLKAFKKLVMDHDIQLAFSGEKYHDNSQLVRYITENNLAHAVFDLGKIDQAELKIAYQTASVVVLPSFYEGFGFSMLEAMASGTPAIGANATSVPEVVGTAGLLFDPTDEDDLVKQIKIAMTDHDIRSGLISKGMVRAEQFSWKQCAERTLQIYREVAQ